MEKFIDALQNYFCHGGPIFGVFVFAIICTWHIVAQMRSREVQCDKLWQMKTLIETAIALVFGALFWPLANLALMLGLLYLALGGERQNLQRKSPTDDDLLDAVIGKGACVGCNKRR